jgi:hypothetical protein
MNKTIMRIIVREVIKKNAFELTGEFAKSESLIHGVEIKSRNKETVKNNSETLISMLLLQFKLQEIEKF